MTENGSGHASDPESKEPKKLLVGQPNQGSKEDFYRLIDGIFERKWFTNNGQLVQEFESRVADYLNVPECVLVVNGTVALEIAIKALELSGEIILPSYTFVATAHAVSWQGLTPVFADIDPTTHTLNVDSLQDLITPRTSAIIPVHTWGRPANIHEIQGVANRAGLKVVYDAAHAFGVKDAGISIGNFGDAEVFSFHSTKFFNSFEGGAITTSNSNLAAKMRLMRNFGFSGYDNVIHSGTNGKMTEICAAMGLVNLDHIDTFISINETNYHQYKRRIAGIPSVELYELDDVQNSNYQYIILELLDGLASERDSLVNFLHDRNVIARRYFWPGVHNMQPYADCIDSSVRGSLENTDLVSQRVIVLPTGSNVSISDVNRVCDIIELWSDLNRGSQYRENSTQ